MQRAELERELEQLHPASFAWALGCCRRDRDDAEEVLQNVYVTVLDGRATFDGRSTLKTWLFAVIRRKATAYYRIRAVRYALLLRFGGGQASSPVQRSQTDLIGALAQLPRRQREVVELVFYHDMTVDDAAAIMGVSAGSARVHYDRAKKKLRVLLEVKS
ncbi:MAG TPA: RNA polymerase sigma factor [Thermoanaerobaculia bacterium]|jgi:RNA polymerase sigma-70 factor (ECF subfamily)|nr:RNA polymerase sigma factor [Thermoanaerobaculia bacterium]